MGKYKVTTHYSLIIEADSEEEALQEYYDTTDGTELEAFAIKIKPRKKRILSKKSIRKFFK